MFVQEENTYKECSFWYELGMISSQATDQPENKTEQQTNFTKVV